jgi:glycosyltransferase involved in cell wall biosynthesis
MRILHLDAGNEMRGGQWQVLRLIEGLIRRGVECTLLARQNSPLFEKARKAVITVEAMGLPAAFRLARHQDLIHAHDARSHTLTALFPGPPLIVARRVAFAIGSRWKYARARRYIAVSEYVKSVLVEGGVAANKIAVVPDGVPLLAQAEGAAMLTPDQGDDPQKGTALALEAARLAGAQLKLTRDLERDLPGAGLFVYVTQTEGLGSAPLLAMSASVPVIASDVGGLREVIQHRQNGLLVRNSAAAIAEAITELQREPALARRLGLAARQTIEERFTIDLMVSRTLAVYHEVLA